MDDFAFLLSKLTPALEARAVEWYGPGAAIAEAPRVQPRDWSFFIRYEVMLPGRAAQALLVKIRRRPDLTVEEALRDDGLKAESKADYDLLRRLETLIQARGDSPARFFDEAEKANYCAIRPLAYFDEFGAVVMEELAARPLRQHLLKIGTALQPAQQNRLEGLFNRAGRWLRVYHEQLGNLHTGPFVSAQVYANYEVALMQIEAAGRLRLDSVRPR